MMIDVREDKSSTFATYPNTMDAGNPDSENKQAKEPVKSSLSNYARFSAMGFQMFAIIGVFTYAGYKIDQHRKSDTPLITAFLSLAGVFIALYLVIRSVKNQKF